MLTKELETVVEALRKAGGKPYVVGGAVRDMMLGKLPKDMDVEVYGLSPEEITSVLKKFGRVDQVGVSFGVIKLKMGKNEYDISLPRRESKAGVGHKGFIVKPDPSMTLEEACSRRDFTVNAMAFCPTEKKVLDFYGGQEDMKNKVLRHTSPAFAEDPLRVLRGFQFASRFEMRVHSETAVLCQKLKEEFPTLAKERIWGEWEKWVTKGKNLRLGLEYLVETGWIDNFSPLKAEHLCLWDDINETVGDPIHTFAVLCRGVSPLNAGWLLRSIGAVKIGEIKDIDIKVTSILDSTHGLSAIQSRADVRRLAVRLTPASIEQLCKFTKMQESELAKTAKAIGVWEKKPEPILMGRHLLEAGFPAGPLMGRILKSVYEAQLDGAVTDLAGALALARSQSGS